MASLGASVKANNCMGLPESRQRIDKMSFPTIAKTKSQHGCVARPAHAAEFLFKQTLPPFPNRGCGGKGGLVVREFEQGRVVLQCAHG